MKEIIQPKLMTVLKEGYTRTLFWSDLSAGVLVGIVALPLAIAFAIASGATPQQGLITAIIAGFLISLLSGSRVQIGGPTGAFIVIVAGIVHTHGMDGLILSTVMAGVLLILMGLFRFGKAIEYIPYPVTVGFTGGIAVIITVGQIPHILGLTLHESPRELFAKLYLYGQNLSSAHWEPILFTTLTIIAIVGLRKVSTKIPGALIALLLFSLGALLIPGHIETVGDRFGAISFNFPRPSLPPFSFALLVSLLPAAFAIALLGGIESLLSAVVADGMTGYRHRSNMELLAQGIANMITPLFGGIPATGAIARTATNIKNGGRTPIAGIIHAITLLFIAIFATSLVGYIPFSVLAGILLVVAFNMGEWHLFKKIMQSTKSDTLILVSTFLLTIFVDLTVAIPIGIVLAAILFMKRMIEVADLSFTAEDPEEYQAFTQKDIEVFEIHGPFFFGIASRYQNLLSKVHPDNKVLIFRMRHVPVMDSTALKALEESASYCKKHAILFILTGLQTQPKKILRTSALCAPLVEASYPSFDEAKSAALKYVGAIE